MAVWKALKGNDPAGNLHLVIGPWYHGQEITEASALGAIKWGQDTGLWFRRKVLAPFLAQYLVDDAPKADIARVTAFETGANQLQRLSDWPNCGAGDCEIGRASCRERVGRSVSIPVVTVALKKQQKTPDYNTHHAIATP